MVAARSVSGGMVECMSVAGVAGNTTVELTLNGQHTSTDSLTTQYMSLVNVSMVSPSFVAGGSEVMVSGSGMRSSGMRCAVGGSVLEQTSWSYSVASLVSSSVAGCMVPTRGAGMHVVEVSLGEGSAMSHSGVQVEYVSAGRVLGVEPSVGVVSGGTIVTLSGEGFVAGRTACRFGSAESTEAEVLSSSEAHTMSWSATTPGCSASLQSGSSSPISSPTRAPLPRPARYRLLARRPPPPQQ